MTRDEFVDRLPTVQQRLIAISLGQVACNIGSCVRWITKFGDLQNAHARHLYAVANAQEAIVEAREVQP